MIKLKRKLFEKKRGTKKEGIGTVVVNRMNVFFFISEFECMIRRGKNRHGG